MEEHLPTYVHKFEYKWGSLLFGWVMTIALIWGAISILVERPPILGLLVILISFGALIWLLLTTMLSKLDLRVDTNGLARTVFGQAIRLVRWQDMKEVTARIANGKSYSGFLVVFKNWGLGAIAEVKHERRLPLIQALNAYLLHWSIPVREIGNFATSDQLTDRLPELGNENDYKRWCHARGWG